MSRLDTLAAQFKRGELIPCHICGERAILSGEKDWCLKHFKEFVNFRKKEHSDAGTS